MIVTDIWGLLAFFNIQLEFCLYEFFQKPSVKEKMPLGWSTVLSLAIRSMKSVLLSVEPTVLLNLSSLLATAIIGILDPSGERLSDVGNRYKINDSPAVILRVFTLVSCPHSLCACLSLEKSSEGISRVPSFPNDSFLCKSNKFLLFWEVWGNPVA